MSEKPSKELTKDQQDLFDCIREYDVKRSLQEIIQSIPDQLHVTHNGMNTLAAAAQHANTEMVTMLANATTWNRTEVQTAWMLATTELENNEGMMPQPGAGVDHAAVTFSTC